MEIKIALAGNPNCGKTTLFNVLTGSSQYVGNWPGVTVEKKEGRLKKNTDVIVTDLPGIYSLSPYTLEEVVARNYLVQEQPDVILNIIDGTNLERSLYLTTQLLELGIPVVLAINMMDIVNKNGDRINIEDLSRQLRCRIVEISALKQTGIAEAVDAVLQEAAAKTAVPVQIFAYEVERTIAYIQKAVLQDVPEERQRWFAVKIFEQDEKVLESLQLSAEKTRLIENSVQTLEAAMDDDAESIITNERYSYITQILEGCYIKKKHGEMTLSDKIDKVVTSRWLGLPIFAVIMFFVYWIAMAGIGLSASNWVNDGVFGNGWHLLGIGSAEYEEASDEYTEASLIMNGYKAYIEKNKAAPTGNFTYEVEDEKTLATETKTASQNDYRNAVQVLSKYGGEPDPAKYGIWIPGISVLAENLLNAMNVSADGAGAVVRGLTQKGIIAGVGAVLGYLPQMFVLFLMLALLEGCGYMARIAFVLDRIFRKFGLSGKSFIPMLIGTGCSIPGIMASRTIENERDRRMTIITTSFIPCSAKLPFIAMIGGAVFGGAAWVATSAYFVGMAAVVVSGIILNKTHLFSGDPAPFVMELPAYHLPTFDYVLRSAGEREWSFIKKAGTIILLSTVLIWFTSYFGFTETGIRMLKEGELDRSILAAAGSSAAWILAPLGWGTWQAAVSSVAGLIAKENIVGTMGILYGGSAPVYETVAQSFPPVAGYSFLVFNLLCAPCFAAIGAVRREMNSAKWTWFAIGYQCGFAYVMALMINQFGNLAMGNADLFGLLAAVTVLVIMIYLLFRPYKEAAVLDRDVKVCEAERSFS